MPLFPLPADFCLYFTDSFENNLKTSAGNKPYSRENWNIGDTHMTRNNLPENFKMCNI